MFYQDATLSFGRRHLDSVCVVKAQTRLSEILNASEHHRSPFLLVEDSDGNPIGIVAAHDLRVRLESATPGDQKRWLDMPVETALSGRMQVPPSGIQSAEAINQGFRQQCTAVLQDDRLLAVATEDDILISWRSVEQTFKNALDDAVTQLPNRTAFDQHLILECRRAQKCGHSVAVILFDVDHFKQVNDQFGHAAGDAVLNAVGRCLRETLRSYDLVARYGGDEFASICSGCLPGEIDVTLDRITRGMKRLQFDTTFPGARPTLSIGACVVHDPYELGFPDRLPVHADKCLYLAKRNGRNQAFATEIGISSDRQHNSRRGDHHHVPPASARFRQNLTTRPRITHER